MAMNNWGGIKEHMTKNPRSVFSHRRTKRDWSKEPMIQLTETQKQQADQKKKWTLIEELLLYLIISLALFIGLLLLV